MLLEFRRVLFRSGDAFYIDLNGYNATNTSAGGITNLTFWEVNNTYFFSVYTTSSVTPISPVGELTVNGANQPILVPFTSTPYTLTFTEHGFPPGSGVPWGVTAIENGTNPTGLTGTGGGFTVPSTTTTVTFNVSAGLYNYSALPLSGWIPEAPTGAGNVTVTSAGGTMLIRFALVSYAQTFYEVGLPAGALWSVDAQFTYPGTTVTGYANVSSLSATLGISLPNGTSPFTVIGSGGYSSPAGQLVISAAPGYAIVVFTIVPSSFTVTFTQTGLPSGSTWTLYAGGLNVSSTSGSASLSLSNGTYTYAVTVPSGYIATPSGGSFVLNGAAYSQSVTVKSSSTSTTSSSGLSTLAYALIGLFVALAVIFLITTLYFARRKPPTTNPPQSWQSSSEATTSETTEPPSNPPST